MSHGCKLMRGRGKLLELAPCTEERGEWEEKKRKSRLCSYNPTAELWSLFRTPAFCLGDPGRDKDACLGLLRHNRINPFGNTLPSLALCRQTVVHTVVIANMLSYVVLVGLGQL